MAGGDDRLSELPDDLLRRVLYFAPVKEGASTTALSRRWRAPLWLSSGAVNLETRVDDYDRYHHGDKTRGDKASFFSRRHAFVSAAVPVTRLTLCLKSDRDDAVGDFLNGDGYKWHGESREKGLIDIVLSHRAARAVEELRLVAKEWRSDAYYHGEFIWDRVGHYTVTLDSLPSHTLRVLELTNCKGLYQGEAAVVVLPRLSSLRLRHCAQHIASLQSIIDSAPTLATVRLESVSIDMTEYSESGDDDDDEDVRRPPKEAGPNRLRCPAATVLVLDRCNWHDDRLRVEYDEAIPLITMEIDAPRLHRFRYKGVHRPFSFSPQPPELEQVDLQFFPDNYRNPRCDLVTFWRFMRSFSSAKEMKLRLINLENIALLREATRVKLLPVFRRLERLELQGAHRPKGKTAGATIANMLRCCPVLHDLRINLTAEQHDDFKETRYVHEFLERKIRYDRDKSINRLGGWGDSQPAFASREEDIDGVNYEEVSDIPALSRQCSSECLQSSLKTVSLQFQSDKATCLGIKLIKFFAQNAMLLQEMHIDAGNKKLHEHVNPKIERWFSNPSKQRNSGATSFVVLPLKR